MESGTSPLVLDIEQALEIDSIFGELMSKDFSFCEATYEVIAKRFSSSFCHFLKDPFLDITVTKIRRLHYGEVERSSIHLEDLYQIYAYLKNQFFKFAKLLR